MGRGRKEQSSGYPQRGPLGRRAELAKQGLGAVSGSGHGEDKEKTGRD